MTHFPLESAKALQSEPHEQTLLQSTPTVAPPLLRPNREGSDFSSLYYIWKQRPFIHTIPKASVDANPCFCKTDAPLPQKVRCSTDAPPSRKSTSHLRSHCGVALFTQRQAGLRLCFSWATWETKKDNVFWLTAEVVCGKEHASPKSKGPLRSRLASVWQGV